MPNYPTNLVFPFLGHTKFVPGSGLLQTRFGGRVSVGFFLSPYWTVYPTSAGGLTFCPFLLKSFHASSPSQALQDRPQGGQRPAAGCRPATAGAQPKNMVGTTQRCKRLNRFIRWRSYAFLIRLGDRETRPPGTVIRYSGVFTRVWWRLYRWRKLPASTAHVLFQIATPRH